MPELPEVETIVRDLRPKLVGRRIATVRAGTLSLRLPWLPAWGPQLSGRRIHRLERRGKWILMVLQEDLHLVIHLGMTGQLLVVPKMEPVALHTHLILYLHPGREELRFRDIRRFGSATLFGNQERVRRFFHEAALGPEPFELDPTYWQGRLAATNRCLKAILLDQRVVAGVGNIYADESLFAAQLHPGQRGCDLKPDEAERLRRAVPAVLNHAIKRRGSTIRNYVGGTGLQGKYQREFRAYGRTGRPCSRCGQPIEQIRLAGRSTHFCPVCQPAQLSLASLGSEALLKGTSGKKRQKKVRL